MNGELISEICGWLETIIPKRNCSDRAVRLPGTGNPDSIALCCPVIQSHCAAPMFGIVVPDRRSHVFRAHVSHVKCVFNIVHVQQLGSHHTDSLAPVTLCRDNMLESTIQATVKTHVHSTVRQHTGAAHAGISKYRIQSGTEIETQTKTTDVNTKAPCNNGTDVEAKAGSYIAFQRKHICDQPQL